MTEPVDLTGVRPAVRALDLSRRHHVHIIGIGGAGMRAIARVLLSMGHTVSGSDGADSEHLARLADLGAQVHVGHAAQHVGEATVVTRSTAVPDTNPEVEWALEQGLRVLARAEVLAAISSAQPSVLVAGTHGKTTTSSMLAVILEEAGRAPSFIIGSDVERFGTGARHVQGSPMVIEADESDGTFLVLRGSSAIITSLDPDHLEYYGGRDLLDAAFVSFAASVDGPVAVCIDDQDAGPLLGLPNVVTYGTDVRADLRISQPIVDRGASEFAVTYRGTELGLMRVALPGLHNALNAAGALTLALEAGVAFADAVAALADFGGVARRFEPRGRAAGVTFIDDYAHLPAEVEAAISTARAGGWGRVVAIYQPHRYSRTQALGHTFASSFDDADRVIITGIYPSGEPPRDGVTGRIVFDAVTEANPRLDVTYAEGLDDVVRELTTELRNDDLCLTLGAGDLTTVPERVIAALHTAWVRDLDAEVPGSAVSVNEPLGPHTTYRVGGPARTFVSVGNRSDLLTVARRASSIDAPVVVVGRGSNLLVADDGFDGIAVSLVDEFERVRIDDDIVTAGAAVPLPALARQTVAAGLTGFEWAVGVPGTIGGAVVMNAGGHGSDMAASVVDAEVLDLSTGEIVTMTVEDLAFGYRRSAISAGHCVLSARLRLAAGDADDGRRTLAEIVRWRRENQPGGQNAGSVFTNPVGDSAGRLIDEAGGKGLRHGTAEVSEKHANFIQVDPGGAADDVYELMRRVAGLVRDRHGVVLEPETRLVGFVPFTPRAERER